MSISESTILKKKPCYSVVTTLTKMFHSFALSWLVCSFVFGLGFWGFGGVFCMEEKGQEHRGSILPLVVLG